MAALVDISIAGRTYQVACREGEEDNLRAAARLVDGKSREALAGLGTLSEARQFLFASLLLADQLIDKPGAPSPDAPQSEAAQAPPPPSRPDPALVLRAEALADRLESLAMALENEAASA
jgi:cell division protein ZapA